MRLSENKVVILITKHLLQPQFDSETNGLIIFLNITDKIYDIKFKFNEHKTKYVTKLKMSHLQPVGQKWNIFNPVLICNSVFAEYNIKYNICSIDL